MNILSLIAELLYSGLGNLASYLAAHVLLCLLPAFYIVGAMTALIPKETVTRFLGRNTPRFNSSLTCCEYRVSSNVRRIHLNFPYLITKE